MVFFDYLFIYFQCLKGQSQKMKKLERELTVKSDEIQKLNVEKEESLEVELLPSPFWFAFLII